MAWFYAVAHEVGDPSPYRLQKLFQPEQIYRGGDRPTSSGAWNKFRNGTRMPGVGTNAHGQDRIATRVGREYPDTLAILNHPLWQAMSQERLPLSVIAAAVREFPRFEAEYYVDLASPNPITLDIVEAEADLGKVWVEIGDHKAAFNHFALHLMLLRVEGIRQDARLRPFLAKRLGRILGFVSEVPWVQSFYERLFDWMDINLWGSLFDGASLDHERRGWKNTTHLWITSAASVETPARADSFPLI